LGYKHIDCKALLLIYRHLCLTGFLGGLRWSSGHPSVLPARKGAGDTIIAHLAGAYHQSGERGVIDNREISD
jgi:hypothetical protein